MVVINDSSCVSWDDSIGSSAMDISTAISIVISIAALITSIANHRHMRVQLAFSNFPVLQIIEAKTRKVSRRDSEDKDLLLNGTALQFKIINRSQDISAIDVSFKVSILRQRTINKLISIYNLLGASEFYRYAWKIIEPGQEVMTFSEDFYKEPILEYWLNTFLSTKAIRFATKNATYQENYEDNSCPKFIVIIEMQYKANRFESKTLKVKDKFLLSYHYNRHDKMYDNGLTWKISQ